MNQTLKPTTCTQAPPKIQVAGAGAFTTYRRYEHAGRLITWQARHHRKGLHRAARALEHLPVRPWETRRYNQIMGAVFALGAALFMVGSLLSFLPHPSPAVSAWVNLIFFLGSLPFTFAAYLQHFQAANTSAFVAPPAQSLSLTKIRWFGWQPDNLGWLSSLTQFLGTLAFNISTLGAVAILNPWSTEDLVIWLPDMVGSALFLVSAYLAFIESCHAYWRWQPKDLSWQIVFVNLVGCVAFMISACTAFIPPTPANPWLLGFSNSQLLLGAICFLVGALLAIREAGAAEPG